MFRDEAKEAQRHRLYGDISLSIPISWHLIGFGLLALLVVLVLFLSFSSYSRVETVSGKIEPDLGLAVVMPSRAGVVTRLLANDGDSVRSGAPLATVRAEEYDVEGRAAPSRALDALSQQEEQVAFRNKITLVGAEATNARFEAQVTGLTNEIVAFDSQIATQHNLIAIASADYQHVREVAERGFISKADLRSRQEKLLDRQQRLASLTQLRTEKVAALAETREGAVEARSAATSAAAQLAGDRASLAGRKSDIEAARGYTLVAPVDGRVTAVIARLGQAVQPTAPVMTILPAGARIQAMLYVPTRAAGFMEVGNQVRLKIDAYPYERFGVVTGRISKFSSSAVSHLGADGKSEPAYLVVVNIPKPVISAFGEVRSLRPDMTLTASIVTSRQSLLQRLFEPLFAVRK